MPTIQYLCDVCRHPHPTRTAALNCERQKMEEPLLEIGDILAISSELAKYNEYEVIERRVSYNRGKHVWHYFFSFGNGKLWSAQNTVHKMLKRGWKKRTKY